MHAFQALLRNQRLRHRDRYDRSGGVHRRRQANRPHLRRDQSRRHKSSRMFRDRRTAQGRAVDPGHARRPARHGHHHLGGAAQRREDRRQGDRPPARGGQRRGSRRHRLRTAVPLAGRPAREHGAMRQPRRGLGPPRGPQPAQTRVRHPAAHFDAGRGAARRRRLPRRVEGRHADARDAAHDGIEPDRHGFGQSRSRNRLRHGRRLAPRHHLRHGPLGLPQPGQ